MELRWNGKYDAEGRRVAPPRLSLPLRTVETVASQHPRNLLCMNEEPMWPNRLIWGDKRYILPSLLPEFAGKVDLIYIDPPFVTGGDFSFTTTVPGRSGKDASGIEQKAYRDTWRQGVDSYLQWFYETVVLLRELLAADGSLYVHLDWHVAHMARLVLDEVFGADCFQNEIAWCYREAINSMKRWNRKHDTILYYVKDPGAYCFNADAVLQPHAEATIAKYRYQDEKGRYRLMGRGITGSPIRSARDVAPHWEQTHPELVYRHYLREGSYAVDYWNIDIINQAAHERLNYPTQKPEALLQRILQASSNAGDLVLDCFCGAGTTAAVAAKLGRRWIACDLGRFAIHTTRKRLLGLSDRPPFLLQTAEPHARLAWQRIEFGVRTATADRSYQDFILNLYGARPIAGYQRLHGVRNDRLIHIGAVDKAIGADDIAAILQEYCAITSAKTASAATGIDILGWDFALEKQEVVQQQATLAGIPLKRVRIPREVLERTAVEQGDIRFLAPATLAVDVRRASRIITVALVDFRLEPDDVPANLHAAITHWEQWIDYWAIDWDYRGDTFHNGWHAYRTRKEKNMHTQATHTYTKPGDYRIMIQVVDIFGNDTTQVVPVCVD